MWLSARPTALPPSITGLMKALASAEFCGSVHSVVIDGVEARPLAIPDGRQPGVHEAVGTAASTSSRARTRGVLHEARSRARWWSTPASGDSSGRA